MPAGYRLRPAAAGDREVVLDFSAGTFEWGDYLDQVWDSWRHDTNGLLLVATGSDDVAVAVGHAQLVASDEVWLEGMRVHPDHRRRGLANALNDAFCAWALGFGATVARLAVEPANRPASIQVSRLGFEKVASYRHYTWMDEPQTSPGRAEPAAARSRRPRPEAYRRGMHARIAAASDAGRLGRLLEAPLLHVHPALAADNWRWARLRLDRLSAAVRAGRVLVGSGGFALIGQDGPDLSLEYLDAPPGEVAALLAGCVDLAEATGRGLAAQLPETAGVLEAGLAAGLAPSLAMDVWARTLGRQGP